MHEQTADPTDYAEKCTYITRRMLMTEKQRFGYVCKFSTELSYDLLPGDAEFVV